MTATAIELGLGATPVVQASSLTKHYRVPVLLLRGVWIFFKPQGGRSLARAITTAERRIMRRASRWGSWRHRNHPPTPQLTP